MTIESLLEVQTKLSVTVIVLGFCITMEKNLEESSEKLRLTYNTSLNQNCSGFLAGPCLRQSLQADSPYRQLQLRDDKLIGKYLTVHVRAVIQRLPQINLNVLVTYHLRGELWLKSWTSFQTALIIFRWQDPWLLY